MSKKNLADFLNKIDQLNLIVKLIKNSPEKEKALTSCKSHEDVIKLTSQWGFDISKRWGEN